MGEQHIVPLSHQAVTLLRELQTITGDGEPVSIAAVEQATDLRQHRQCSQT